MTVTLGNGRISNYGSIPDSLSSHQVYTPMGEDELLSEIIKRLMESLKNETGGWWPGKQNTEVPMLGDMLGKLGNQGLTRAYRDAQAAELRTQADLNRAKAGNIANPPEKPSVFESDDKLAEALQKEEAAVTELERVAATDLGAKNSPEFISAVQARRKRLDGAKQFAVRRMNKEALAMLWGAAPASTNQATTPQDFLGGNEMGKLPMNPLGSLINPPADTASYFNPDFLKRLSDMLYHLAIKR